ncbi:MAG: trypsin-like peptidase domain-containing protein [Gammaproteobacteria bacterium]
MERGDVERALAKVLAGGKDTGKRFIGSAFFIDARHLLTARHCVESVKRTERLFLRSYTGHGECPDDTVGLHPERDIALLRIVGQNSPAECALSVPPEAEAPKPRTAVTVWGFSPDGGSAEERPRTVIEPAPEFDAVRLDQSIAKGMSGGPVLDGNGQLVGVLYGRSPDSDCQYVVPVSAIASWLDEHRARSTFTLLPGWLKGYLESHARAHEDMPTDVMLRLLGTGQNIPHLRTRSLYVPLHVEPRRSDDPSSPPRVSSDPPQPQPLLEALAERQRLVVRGDPGSGKSTFLRYLALRLGARLRGEQRNADEHEEALPDTLDFRLPLFVELKGFYRELIGEGRQPLTHAPTCKAVDDAMRRSLASHYPDLGDVSRISALYDKPEWKTDLATRRARRNQHPGPGATSSDPRPIRLGQIHPGPTWRVFDHPALCLRRTVHPTLRPSAGTTAAGPGNRSLRAQVLSHQRPGLSAPCG